MFKKNKTKQITFELPIYFHKYFYWSLKNYEWLHCTYLVCVCVCVSRNWGHRWIKIDVDLSEELFWWKKLLRKRKEFKQQWKKIRVRDSKSSNLIIESLCLPLPQILPLPHIQNRPQKLHKTVSHSDSGYSFKIQYKGILLNYFGAQRYIIIIYMCPLFINRLSVAQDWGTQGTC